MPQQRVMQQQQRPDTSGASRPATTVAGTYAAQSAQARQCQPVQSVPPVCQQPQAARSHATEVGTRQQPSAELASVLARLIQPRGAILHAVHARQQMLSDRMQLLQTELAAVVRQQQNMLALAQGMFGANQQNYNSAYNQLCLLLQQPL